jgi:hypothetical protein
MHNVEAAAAAASQPKNEHELGPELQALFSEYKAAHVEVKLRRLELTKEMEKLEKAEDEVINNVHGTVRSIVRINKLEGNWRPNEDGSKLVRSS